MVIRSMVLIVMCLVAIAGPAEAGTPAENKAIVEGFVAVGNSRDYDRLGDYTSKDLVRHCQTTPGLVITNLEQFKAFMVADVQVCPDSKLEVQQIVLEFAPIFRFEEDKIVELARRGERWVHWIQL